MTIEKFLSLVLAFHIASGALSLISGLVAMLTKKGSKPHRLAGRVYFGGMTGVFVSAIVVSIGRHNQFLLLVAFFSYYFTVRGYRALYLKQLHQSQKPAMIDWLIFIVATIFILWLFFWGVLVLRQGMGIGMGIVGIVFAAIGAAFLIKDVRSFTRPPKVKTHWWFTHLSSMGGSYIATVTAFVVVNFRLPQYNWVLWILPGMIGGVFIAKTSRKYQAKFDRAKS